MDSAGGNIKKKRPETAGLMLLRGKVLNTGRTDFASVLENKELMMISKGIGATLTDSGFSLLDKNLRFGKIIIATDADEDGAAIRSLLLTFFYKYYPQLLKQGVIYSLAPKLFSINWKKQEYFFATEKELKEFEKINKIKSGSCHISRYKGLGSYTQDQFYTQIDPQTRDLIQITINDAKKASQAIKLMEDDMTARRQLINGEFYFDDDDEKENE